MAFSEMKVPTTKKKRNNERNHVLAYMSGIVRCEKSVRPEEKEISRCARSFFAPKEGRNIWETYTESVCLKWGGWQDGWHR